MAFEDTKVSMGFLPSRRAASIPKRIWVIGHPGSGKTTLSAKLSSISSAPLLDLDGVFWGPNWTKCSPEAFCYRVRQFVEKNQCWIIDGMYEHCSDIILRDVDLVIYLKVPLHRLLGNVMKRSTVRILRNIELWNGNRESIARLLWKDALLYYLVSSYRPKITEATRYLEQAREKGAATITLQDWDMKRILPQLERLSQ